jgi:tetratricopeptide (TPR) repeat protein
MKNYMILVVSLLAGSFIHAQSLESAIKKTDNEMFEAAASDFKLLVAKEPTKADNYFYYGENYFQSENLDSAYILWQKGLAIDPTSALNLVGVGKHLWYAGDTLAGKEKFNAALTATKNKNAEVMRQIGSVYVNAPIKALNQAVTLLTNAIKIDSKNVDGHLLLGDALLELTPTNGTEAMKSYNTALELAKMSKIVVRKAKVYQRAQNYQLANDMYIEAQDLEPTYAPAYRENAELNMKFNQTSRAVENWLSYLELNNSSYARYRYATSLFSGKRYCEAVKEFQTVHESGYESYYSQRLLGYSLYECTSKVPKTDTANYRLGMIAMDRFFSIVPENKIIAMDFKYKGLLFSKLGKDSLAIIELGTAIKKDSINNVELYGELAKLYMKYKKYDLVISSLNAKMGSDSTKLTVMEYNDLGRAYYFGAKNYLLSDAAYANVAKLSPTYAMAFLWRARSNVQMDLKKVTWAARPYYEKLLEMVPEADRTGPYKQYIIEAAKYMGDYYYNSPAKDLVKSKEAWTIVKTIDPEDKQAKAFFATAVK